MSELKEHHLNIHVVDVNGRKIPGATVAYYHIGEDAAFGGCTTNMFQFMPSSIQTPPEVKAVVIEVTYQSHKMKDTVDLERRNVTFKFKDVELPGAPMKTEIILAFTFGVVGIATMLAIALFLPNPTPFQYTIFRILLALECAGVAAVIPGILSVKIGNFIKASSAIGSFVIIYFYS